MGRLAGRVAIVTGAAGGIGAATAALFVKEGARVMLVDHGERALREVTDAIGGDRVAMVTADVSDVAATDAYVSSTVKRFGGIDVVFANAGTEGRFAPLTEVPIEQFDRVVAINVSGVFLAIRAAAPHIEARGGGSIICTSSVAGLIAAAGLGPYVASKHAVVGLMRAAAVELGPKRIRVNSLNPGPIENRMMRSIEEQASPGHGDRTTRPRSLAAPADRSRSSTPCERSPS